MSSSENPNRSLLRYLTGAAAFCVLLCCLRMASPVLSQILVIIFLTILVSPIYDLFRKIRIPSTLSSLLLVLLVFGVVTYAVVFAIIPPTLEFSKQIPTYHRQITECTKEITDWCHAREIKIPEHFLRDLIALNQDSVGKITKDLAAGLLSFTQNSVFLLIILAFMIFELPHIPHYLKHSKWMTPGRWDLFQHFVWDVRHYMSIKTMISMATGSCIYIGLSILSVPYASLLGIIAFFLNFIPIVGSMIAAAPGILLALSSGTLSTGIWTGAIYLLVNQVLGNIIEPRVMGRGFGVSPVAVIFSVLIWGWVLGPMGMLAAVPITLAIRGAVTSLHDK